MHHKSHNLRKKQNTSYQNNRNLGFTGQYQWPQPSEHYYPQDNNYIHSSHQEHEDNFNDYRVRHPENYSYQFDNSAYRRRDSAAGHRSNWSPERAVDSRPEFGPVQQSVNPGFQTQYRSHEFNTPSKKSFSGRGPKGYRRSDERIKEDISYALMQSDEIDASEVEVDVQNGVVILDGSVEDRAMKRAIEDCAEQILGVLDVRNQLRVSPAADAILPPK